MQDVPGYARRKGLEFRDHLDERLAAELDAEHCVRINYEAYLFGSLYTRERFLSDPLLYCGLLTDPVSKRRFRANADSPAARDGEVTYYFESQAHRSLFEADPEAYRLPGWAM